MIRRNSIRLRRAVRRGFNLVELLIALSITSALLTATMVALDASFMAYQTTTETASTHTIGRLVMHRILTLIRSGSEFGPVPLDPTQTVVESDSIDFLTLDADGNEQIISLVWIDQDTTLEDESLYAVVGGQADPNADWHLLLQGVIPQDDGGGGTVAPFKLEFVNGRTLYRATVDLLIQPDDNLSTDIDGGSTDLIHLVASAMPREIAFDQ